MNWKKVALTTGASATMLIALPFTAREEGVRTSTYLDSANVQTYCYGETEHVPTKPVSQSECEGLFFFRLGAYSYWIDMMIAPPMSPEIHAAFTSWAYNVGLSAAKKSTLIQLANSGDFLGACSELLKWKYSNGKPILLPRRKREYNLCMEGL